MMGRMHTHLQMDVVVVRVCHGVRRSGAVLRDEARERLRLECRVDPLRLQERSHALLQLGDSMLDRWDVAGWWALLFDEVLP